MHLATPRTHFTFRQQLISFAFKNGAHNLFFDGENALSREELTVSRECRGQTSTTAKEEQDAGSSPSSRRLAPNEQKEQTVQVVQAQYHQGCWRKGHDEQKLGSPFSDAWQGQP